MWLLCCCNARPESCNVQATVCAKFGLKCIVYMGAKVGQSIQHVLCMLQDLVHARLSLASDC